MRKVVEFVWKTLGNIKAELLYIVAEAKFPFLSLPLSLTTAGLSELNEALESAVVGQSHGPVELDATTAFM